jgi:hypothetical protein
MAKCTKCFHNCHCSGELHADEYGTCGCKDCECINKQERAQDLTYESKSDVCVVDDTGECESCQ